MWSVEFQYYGTVASTIITINKYLLYFFLQIPFYVLMKLYLSYLMRFFHTYYSVLNQLLRKKATTIILNSNNIAPCS